MPKATNTDTAIGKYPIGQTPFFQKEDFRVFEVSKIGPTIITLPPHRIDFRGDSELQVAVKFGAVNFRRELSQISPTVCVINCQNCLETSLLGLR